MPISEAKAVAEKNHITVRFECADAAGLSTSGAIRALATEAGFRRTDLLDVDGGFFRIYALRP